MAFNWLRQNKATALEWLKNAAIPEGEKNN